MKHLALRFEDFLANPEDGLRDLLAFCNLPQEAELLPAAHHSLPPGSISGDKWYPMNLEPNEKYLRGIDKKHRDLIAKITGDVAESFGYEPPTVA